MNFSAFFVHRPVATTLLTLGIALSGALAFLLLPVAPLPQVDFPTISVQASLPGASPETMAATVATPLERALGRIAGVSEMTSSSSLGSTRVTLQFDLDRNIDGAARDVQAALNAARSLLPTGLPSNPTYRKVNPADSPIMILSLTSDTLSRGQMYDAASSILAQKLAQIEGIGQVNVGGSSLPAVRVELIPAALHKYGIGTEAVRSAIAAANANRPKGMVEDGTRHWQIHANDQAREASEYLPLIVAYRNGAAVHLSDVAEVNDSVQDLRNAGSANGRPAVLVILYRQPGANIIETVDRITDRLPALNASIPSAIDLAVVFDRTPTIRASLHEVERTLLISVALVIMVVFVFLRKAAAALIPSVVVPVSLLGTFGVMYLRRLQPEQPVADGADGCHRLRGGRCDRGAGEHLAAHRTGHGAARGGAGRRARGRLHGALDEPVADRRVHSHFADGRHRRTLVPRVCRNAVGRHSDFPRALAHHDADDERAPAQARAQGGRRARPVARKPPRIRGPRARLRTIAWLGAAPRPLHDAAARSHHRPERVPVRHRAQGILSATGHRAPGRLHPGGPGHLVSGHAEKARRFRRHRAQRPGRGERHRLHRRRTAQQRRPCSSRSNRSTSANLRGQGHGAAARKAPPRARRQPVPARIPGYPHGWTRGQRPIRVHLAGRRSGGTARVGTAHPPGD